MDPKFDAMYLDWLYSLVERKDDLSYSNLLTQMFRTEFEWFVPNDDNRAKDGVNLRRRFIFETSVGRPDHEWMVEQCSFLEMLISLAETFGFQMDLSRSEAFWHMMRNLGFDESYSDQSNFDPRDAEAILNRVIWRKYEYNGSGGIFPLEEPDRDQREVELIYQLYKYALELEF